MPASIAKPSARERLLDAADELFYNEGIQTVGIDRVIERAGVAKASLYSCFGSKEALVEAYLKRRHTARLESYRELAAATPDPRAKILAIFDAQAAACTRPNYHCPFVAAATEAPRGGLIDIEARAFRRDIHDLFRDLAAGAGAEDPQTLATQLQMVYDGASNAARTSRGDGTSGPARAMVELLLDTAPGVA